MSYSHDIHCIPRFHLIHSNSGESCALMLVEYSTSRGFPSEVDLFITQAVLQYLCLSNMSTATIAFKIYTANHPAIKVGIFNILQLNSSCPGHNSRVGVGCRMYGGCPRSIFTMGYLLTLRARGLKLFVGPYYENLL